MEYNETSNSNELLVKISELAVKQKRAELKVAELTEQLETAVEEFKLIAEFQLPDLMEEAQMSEITTLQGYKLTYVNKIHCPVSGEKQGALFDFLHKTKNNAIIKSNLVIEFEKNAQGSEAALQIKKDLSEKYGVSEDRIVDKSSVHWSTLTSLLNKMAAEGEVIPMDEIGAYNKRNTVVKLKK